MNTLLNRLVPRRAAILLAALVLAAVPLFATSASASASAPAEVKPIRAADICNYSTDRPTIGQGNAGPAVKQAQCYLNLSMTGDNLTIDGIFGPLTRNATLRFQRCAGIGVDGIIGPQTWASLNYWANSPG